MTAEPRLVELGPAGAELLAALHAQCFADPDVTGPAWDDRSFADLLSLPGTFALVAVRGVEADASPAGLILARTAADEGEILTIGVLPQQRRGGVARHLVRGAMAHAAGAGATTLFLEVAETNAPARGLYSSLGFNDVGRRRGYYRLGGRAVDAIIMAGPAQFLG